MSDKIVNHFVLADGSVARLSLDATYGLETITSATNYAFTKNKSITTNVNPVNYENPVTESNWSCVVVSCQAGDVFYVKGWGGTGGRLYCFVDANHNYINSTIAPEQTHLTDFTKIIAPSNAVVLVMNSKYTEIEGQCIKGKSMADYVDGLQSDYNLKLSEKLDYDNGVNICNAYDSSRVVDNAYVHYNNGVLSTLADWCSIFFPVNGGQKITTTNTAGGHMSFYSQYIDDFGDLTPSVRLAGFISGVTGSLTGYDVPENAKYMIVSVPMNRKGTVQVEYGTERTAYEPYIEGLKASKVIGLEQIETVTYSIKADGSGDFANLKLCLESITDASATKKYIVNLYPGVYDIASLYSDYSGYGLFVPNYVSLKGIGDKHNVVIKAELETQSTSFSPLNVRNYIECENLTMESVNCRYTVHDDWQSANDTPAYHKMKNCILKGERTAYGSVYGSGLKGNSVWEFENVEIHAETSAPDGGAGNAFSNHNNTNVNTASFITFKNCRLKNGASQYKTVRLNSMTNGSENGTVTVTFEGCYVDGIHLGENSASQYGAGICYWVNGYGNENPLGVAIVNTDGEDYSGNVDLI